MAFRKLIMLMPLLLVFSCGSGSDDKDIPADLSDEAGVVNAVILDYNISVDNLPLVGPLAENLKLTIFKHLVKYEGTAEISVGNEKRLIKRKSIVDFTDNSQVFIDDTDSSYKKLYFEPSHQSESYSNSPKYIQIIKTDELSEKKGFPHCRKIKLIPFKRSLRPGIFNDSTPVLRGEMWVKSDYSIVEPILNYYNLLGTGLRGSDFIGLEIWRVFDQLGIPKEVILDILEAIDGLIVSGDFTCTMYSLGKKANVAIDLSLTDVTVKRIAGEELKIPDGYKSTYEKENQLE